MNQLTTAQREAWSLMEGFTDVGMAAKKKRVAELLDCDESDVDAAAHSDFIGRLDGNEVWHGRYKGEIYRENRFLYKTSKGSIVRGTPGTPGRPGTPARPASKSSISMPSGYRDVEFD